MAKNKDMIRANRAKADEFYTQFVDIEKELSHYKEAFCGKVVFCNCDDPYESDFFKFLALNFNRYKLKKLIATCYVGSPIASTQLTLFDYESAENKTTRAPHKIVITEVTGEDGNGAVNLADVRLLLQNKKNVLTRLEGDGDFRSAECIELLKEADIVVTNPPFSLFREYVAQLFEYDKKFIIIGNQNAITYKEFFPLLMENKVWLGCSIHSGDREFRVPDSYPITAAGFRVDADGNKYIRVKGVRWFTNLDYKERHEELPLYMKYTPEEYPTYDEYEAIEVSKTANIPRDYDGMMGVPITFLDKYCPEQFEIIGLDRYVKDNPHYGYRFTINGKETYARILIRRKKDPQ